MPGALAGRMTSKECERSEALTRPVAADWHPAATHNSSANPFAATIRMEPSSRRIMAK
jgi:hypothetical protein